MGGVYQPPQAERFAQLAREVPQGNIPAMARTVVDYSLERSGLVLAPEQLSQTLETLTVGEDWPYDQKLLDSFLAYCDTMDLLDREIRNADAYIGGLTFDQLSVELPRLTLQCNYANVPAMQIIDKIFKSEDESYKRVGNVTRKHAQAIVRVLFAWQENIELPQPEQAAEAV
jgi:hypothetical protein